MNATTLPRDEVLRSLGATVEKVGLASRTNDGRDWTLRNALGSRDPLATTWADVEFARRMRREGWTNRAIDRLPSQWDEDSADAIADLVTFRL